MIRPMINQDVMIVRLHPDATIPTYAHGPIEDAGMDLVSIEDVSIKGNSRQIIKTGIAIELPPGFEAQVRPRSGMALKGFVAHLGTIDPGYRGEIGVIMHNLNRYECEDATDYIAKGTKIAQLVVAPYIAVTWVLVAQLGRSQRGVDGYGSTDPKAIKCIACGGTGGVYPGSKCKECNGTGLFTFTFRGERVYPELHRANSTAAAAVKCVVCKGSGFICLDHCLSCGGTGVGGDVGVTAHTSIAKYAQQHCDDFLVRPRIGKKED